MKNSFKMIFIVVVTLGMLLSGGYLALLLFFSHALWPEPADAKYFIDRDLGWTALIFAVSLTLWLIWGRKWGAEQ